MEETVSEIGKISNDHEPYVVTAHQIIKVPE